ncbi:MAG: glycosyltransferase family 2 protein [Verrucomicrobiota bacterium]
MTYPQINILVPLHNEKEVFDSLIRRLNLLMDSTALTISIILVDDGSTDSTTDMMKELSLNDDKYSSVILSRNFGHQLALTAGMKYVNATEAVMIIDGDLQDPPELLGKLYSYYKDGYDVVYAVRQNRKEGFLKKFAYSFFYRLLKKISYIDIPIDSGDFSLVSRRVIDELNRMPEESRYIRGMRSWIGFKQTGVPYEREKRSAGESKYPLNKLISLAYTGIFNFSEYPVKLMVKSGMYVIISSFMYLLYTLIQKLFFNSVPGGFTALLAVISLFGGMQLIAIGMIGEYIIRIFFQVKNRPLYIVKEVIEEKIVKNG